MAERTVHAIVLRRNNSGETDRRLTLLTEESGKLDAVAKGARKSASRLGSVSDPLSVAIFGIAEGKRNRFITQAQPIQSFRGLRRDYDRLSLGLSLCELAAAVLPWESPLPETYNLLINSLAFLETHTKPFACYAWASVHLLGEAGFLPSFDVCVVTGAGIRDARSWLSPRAGGFIVPTEAAKYPDAFQAASEVLIGLARLPNEEAPPANLKRAEEAIIALFPFWRAAAETALPASLAVVNELRFKGSEGTGV